MNLSQVGLIGLGVMGKNLALNIARHGFSVCGHDLAPEAVDAFTALGGQAPEGAPVRGADDLQTFVQSLAQPRRIILLIKAGEPVDTVLGQLRPLLDEGDMIVDGGNSHPDDTARRASQLDGTGVGFVGMGISGGEEGALNGPSLMPGGPAESYAVLRPILESIAAQVADGPCVTHVGPGAAGHFVKVVHNGIEYADMQLIAEAYDILDQVLGMDPRTAGEHFETWNRGPMESYLTEITARALRDTDPETGKPMLHVIVDRAGQKGTGRWTCELGLRHGVPIPTIQAAVSARGLSSLREQRIAASTLLHGPDSVPPAPETLVEDLEQALFASKICAYAQGLALIQQVSDENGWNVNLGAVAKIWKGGCIIRARMLERIQKAFASDAQAPANLLLDPELSRAVHEAQTAWRRTIATATVYGIPLLAMNASLAYFDSYRRARLPQNLTQAQRDLFGAHTFERTDRAPDEWFHHQWN